MAEITDEQVKCVRLLEDEVCEMIKRTDNSCEIEIGSAGISINAMRGPFEVEKPYEISAFSSWENLDDYWTLNALRALIRLTAETEGGGKNDLQ